MKKKQKTFADRAKEIKNKYTRAEWDPIERKDMMKELSILRDEQEQVRAAMGIADGADQMDKFDGLNDTQYLNKKGFDWTDPTQVHPANISNLNMPSISQLYEGSKVIGNSKPLDNSKLIKSDVNNNNYQPLSASPWPSVVSAGASAIGDIAGLMYTKNHMPKSVSLPRVAPTQINLQPQREALGRENAIVRNTMLRNSRDVSNPANAYANQVAGLSALTDSFGTQMGQSYMNESNTNAQLQQNTNIKNAEIGSQEALTNAQMQGNRANVNLGYINSLSQTIPLALRDYRQQVNEMNMVNNMGKDYAPYTQNNPNLNSWQKFIQGLKGQDYKILNRQYVNSLNG
jgi:hypothetical protein